MYHDSIEVFELLDRWNQLGPPAVDALRDLFRRRPLEAKRVSNIKNRNLLHKCLEHYARREDLVRLFAECYPDAISEQDDDGYLPLHLAVCCNSDNRGGVSSSAAAGGNSNISVIRFLVEKYPESVITETKDGKLPMHLACQSSNDDGGEVVQYLIQMFPDALLQRDNANHFPLDYALDNRRKCINNNMVRYLIEGSGGTGPLTLPDNSQNGQLCLHRIVSACHEKYDIAVEIVVKAFAGALRVQDNDYHTPLLIACEENNTISQVYTLLRAWPEQITTHQARTALASPTFNGELIPATVASATIGQVQQWVTRYPNNEALLSIPDVHGRLPLHYAVVSASVDVVNFLLEKHPDAAAAADNHKRTPFHYVALRPQKDGDETAVNEILDALLNYCPDGLVLEDEDERLPWHYADCARNDCVLERTLERHSDDSELDMDMDMVPEHVRWDIVQARAEN